MKTWIMIVPFVSGAFGAVAQNFYGGIYGGLLKNDIMVTDQDAQQYSLYNKKLTTIDYGIHFGRQLTNRWGLETQVQFVSIVNKKEFDMFNPLPGEPMFGSIQWYNKSHYIRVPLLVQYTVFSSKSRFGLALLAGPNFGWMRQQHATFKNEDESSPSLLNNPTLTGVALKKFDMGVQAGIRARMQLYKSIYLYTEGAIYQGLSDVAKEQQPIAFYDGAGVKNRHFSLNFGIQYDLSAK